MSSCCECYSAVMTNLPTVTVSTDLNMTQVDLFRHGSCSPCFECIPVMQVTTRPEIPEHGEELAAKIHKASSFPLLPPTTAVVMLHS